MLRGVPACVTNFKKDINFQLKFYTFTYAFLYQVKICLQDVYPHVFLNSCEKSFSLPPRNPLEMLLSLPSFILSDEFDKYSYYFLNFLEIHGSKA